MRGNDSKGGASSKGGSGAHRRIEGPVLSLVEGLLFCIKTKKEKINDRVSTNNPAARRRETGGFFVFYQTNEKPSAPNVHVYMDRCANQSLQT
jgi:hypothetical protein